MHNPMTKSRLKLFKNRAIEHGKYWINYNKKGLNDVRSLKDKVSNIKRNFNKHLDEERKKLMGCSDFWEAT